jgi:DNA helicase II / ATP-dependent DNA helicase PcrA
MFALDSTTLNNAQRAAVDHDGRPLLILAGAGTGKTKTLAARVGRLLADGAAPERVCLLTFSRRAAQGMLTRAGRTADPAAAKRVWGGTFHAVGHRLLRRYGPRVGLNPGFTVLDEGDTVELMGLVRHELGLAGGKGRRFPKAETLAKVYSRVVNTQESLKLAVESSFPWCATEVDGMRDVIRAYMVRKRAQNLIDFDDLLLLWRALGAGSAAPLTADLFDHVLVDEYQDTNALQADIVNLLCPRGKGLTVVGDDAQAIYSFRAATPRNILEFPTRFPNTTIINLEENYRSTTRILAVANAVMAEAKHGYPKTLWSGRTQGRRPLLRRTLDDAEEASAVCDSVLAHREDGVLLQDQAVLFRAAHHSDVLEIELHRRNIPFVKHGGLRFLEAAHVKDLLAMLRIMENPHDELAWFRVLRLPDGIGPAKAARLMNDLGVRRDPARPATTSPLTRFVDVNTSAPPSNGDELLLLRRAVADCVALGQQTTDQPGLEVERLRRFLDPSVGRRYDNSQPRIADLEAIQHIAAGYNSRASLLADLALDPPSSTSDLAGDGSPDDDWLVLSTVHSAKGGEWRVVHIIHASDGLFPSDLATGKTETLEEERRLFYVAVTRARDVLEINATQQYYYQRNTYADPHGYGQLSRFLSPQVQTLLDHEQVHPAGPAPPEASATAGSVTAVDQLIGSLLA